MLVSTGSAASTVNNPKQMTRWPQPDKTDKLNKMEDEEKGVCLPSKMEEVVIKQEGDKTKQYIGAFAGK